MGALNEEAHSFFMVASTAGGSFPGWGLNLCHTCNQSHSSDNAGSLVHRAILESWVLILLLLLPDTDVASRYWSLSNLTPQTPHLPYVGADSWDMGLLLPSDWAMPLGLVGLQPAKHRSWDFSAFIMGESVPCYYS